MPDPKIIEYLRQHGGKYPVDSLKQALIKNGFNPADVDEAVRLLETGSAPPPPAPETVPSGAGAAGPGEGGRLRYGVGGLLSNAAFMFKDPEGFFSRLDPEAGIGGGILNVVLWALIAALLNLVLVLAGISAAIPYARVMAAVGLVVAPVLALVFTFIGSVIFHVLCKVMGGNARYSASYNVLAGIMALAPINLLLHLVHPMLGALVPQLYVLYLMVQAAWAVHGVAKKRAWFGFGTLTAISIGLMVSLAVIGRRFQSMMANGQMPQAIGQQMGMPLPTEAQQALGQAQQMAQQAMQMPGVDPQAQQQFQSAMQQTGQMMQDMNRYGAMETPPAETLALLDQKGQARLAEVWPALSAPVRQSLVQALPQTPANQRMQSIEQVVQATAGVNEMMNQSMQLLQQLQQNPQPKQKRSR